MGSKLSENQLMKCSHLTLRGRFFDIETIELGEEHGKGKRIIY